MNKPVLYLKSIIITLLWTGALTASNKPIQKQTVFIVVHGTWANHCSWYQPEGDFFLALEQSAAHIGARLVSFCWDSKNTHEARLRAARQLEKLIMSYGPGTNINVVSHSHGANVANLASQLLARHSDRHIHVKAFYHLGVPVCLDQYLPNMDVVEHVYNFFSYNDFVQPVLGLFKREYPQHDRIANIRITINGVQPAHSLIHDPEIAHWIPLIHEGLATKGVHGFDSFQFGVPGLMHFCSDQHVCYTVDVRRSELCHKDRYKIGATRALFVRCVVPKLFPELLIPAISYKKLPA